MLGAGILAPNAGEMIGAVEPGDRPAGEAEHAGFADRALSDPLRGRQSARPDQLFRPAPVLATHQAAGSAAGPVAVNAASPQFVGMTESHAGPPRVRPRQSLSGRLWLLTTLAVLLSEVVVFLPYIAHERRNWLFERIDDASIAMLAAAGDRLKPACRPNCCFWPVREAIRLISPDGQCVAIGDMAGTPADDDRSARGRPAQPAFAARCAPSSRARTAYSW